MINLEDVVVSLYDGTIGLEDIEEAYLNHELSNDDIDVINEAIDYIENQEPISEISADLAKKVYDRHLDRYHRYLRGAEYSKRFANDQEIEKEYADRVGDKILGKHAREGIDMFHRQALQTLQAAIRQKDTKVDRAENFLLKRKRREQNPSFINKLHKIKNMFKK